MHVSCCDPELSVTLQVFQVQVNFSVTAGSPKQHLIFKLVSLYIFLTLWVTQIVTSGV